MSEGLAGGIIAMDIKSVFDRAAFDSVIKDMTSQFSSASNDMGKLFGKNLGSGTADSMAKMRAAIEKEMRAAQSAVEDAMGKMVSAGNAQINSAGKIEAAQARLNEVVGKYGENSSKAISASNALTKAQQDAEKASRDMQGAMSDQAAASDALTAATARQKAAQDEAAATTGKFGAAAQTAGLAITAGLTVAVGAAIDKAAEFQTTQNRLVTSAGESADNLKAVSDGILDMAGKVGVSAQQLSTGMYTVESAGYHGADSLKVLQAAAQGAQMEGAELGTVADAVSTALSDYHLSADQAGTVTSQLVTAVGQGKTTMEEFSSSLHSITPLAASAGISLADATGSLAEMTAHGMSADQASQNLADTLRHLISPTAEMRTEFAQLGLSSTDVQNSLSTNGLAGTLDMLTTKIAQQAGPDGKLLLDSFNSSKDAAANLQSAITQLPPALQTMAQGVVDGTTTVADWKSQVKGLPENQAALASSFLEMYDKANGFTNALKNGTPQMQTATQAIKDLMGDATGLNTTLMLTGDNASATANNVKLISGATTDAQGNVKGWDDIQKTFNQKMDEFKASIGATAISLGTSFLPAATQVAGSLADVGNWLQQNKGYLDALLIAAGAAAGAFLVFKVASAMWTVIDLGIQASTASMVAFGLAEDTATAETTGLAAALAATGISEVVIGVTALVAALIGLAMGVKYAYDHWGWFKTAVDDTWTVLKAVGEWIAREAVQAWHLLEQAIGPTEAAFKAVGDAAMWLWHNVIQPATDGIGTALKVVAAVVLTVLAVPFVLAFKLIEAAVKALYNDVILPVFHLIETIFHWLYENVIQPVIALIEIEIQGWGEIFHWLHEQVIDPVFHLIGDVWHWLYDTIIKPIIDLIKIEIQGWGAIFNWLHDTVIKPVGDAIGTVMDGLKTAFKDVVDWLDQQWGRIEGIVGPPVKFIIDTVYNEGIVPTWNAIAGVFGLGKLDKVNGGLGAGSDNPPAPAPHAGGGVWQGAGVLPGYAPGRDSVNAVLSPGEGVAVPEFVQAIGPGNFMRLNHMFSGGRKPGSGPGFDAGGVFSPVTNLIGGAVDAGKSAINGAVDTAKFLAKLATDPEGAVKDLFSSVTDKVSGIPGQPSQWIDMLKSVPSKVIDAVIDKAKSWIAGGGGSAGGAGTPFTGSPDLAGWIAQAIAITGVNPATWMPGMTTLIGRESAGNPNAVNNWDSNAAAGHPSKGLTQTIPSTFEAYRDKSLPDNIFDPVANIVASIHYIQSRYGDISNVQQANPSMPPKGYSGGGIHDGKSSDNKKAQKTPKPPDMTAINRAMSWIGTVTGTALDPASAVSGIFQSLVGGDTTQQAFNVGSDFSALGFQSGSGAMFDIGLDATTGAMGATLNGHNVQSTTDGGVVMDGVAHGGADSFFPTHWWLPGKLFNPVYKGAGDTPNAAQNRDNKLSSAAQKYANQAASLNAEADKADAQAQKDLSEGKKDAAAQSQARAADLRKRAQDAQAKADQAQQDAQTQSDDANSTTDGSTTGSSTSPQNASSNGFMTFHDLGEKLGGIGADALTETFGLDSLAQTFDNSRILKLNAAMQNATFGAPYLDKFFAPPGSNSNSSSGSSPSTTTTASTPAPAGPSKQKAGQTGPQSSRIRGSAPDAGVFDTGGWLQPGDIAMNLGRRPEPILSPTDMDAFHALARGASTDGGNRPWVNIEQLTHVGGDEQQTARSIVREMNRYQPRGAR